MTAAYPPEHHLLRDLRFSFEHDDDGQPEPGVDAGRPRAVHRSRSRARRRARHARRRDRRRAGRERGRAGLDRDRRSHLAPRARGARRDRWSRRAARCCAPGRTTVVIEVALVDEHERDIGIATMSFAVLPRRDTNPEIDAHPRNGPSTMATRRVAARAAVARRAGRTRCATRRAAMIDVPVIDWSLNSMGAMQGGVVATVAEVAAETALRAATGRTARRQPTCSVTYLGFGEVGPVRSQRRRARPRPTGHGSAARRARRRRRREPPDDGRARGRRREGSRERHDDRRRAATVGALHGRRACARPTSSALVGHAAVAPHLRGPAGGVRTGALLTMLDNVGGLCGGLAALPEGWVVSTNLAARVVALAHVGPLRLDVRRAAARAQQRGDDACRSATRAPRDALVAERRAHVGDPRSRERPAAVGPSARARHARRASADRSAGRSPTGSACAPVGDARGRDRSRRRAAQSVGHPPRRRRRDAGRPGGRARDRRRPRRPTSCCTSSRRTASARCGRPRVRSAAPRRHGVPRRSARRRRRPRRTALAIATSSLRVALRPS